MEKFFIDSREGKKISVILEKNDNQKGLVFVMHGLGSSKEADYIKSFAKAFREKGFTVVRFDNRHSIGESEGDYRDVNFTKTYQDLVDVINWSKKQSWHSEKFVLVGHSLGGGCVLWYGSNHPEDLLAIVPISTVIGGHQTLAKFDKKDLIQFLGAREKLSFISRILLEWKWWKFKEDILKYDIVPEAHKFNMPFLMIVGDQDNNTPLEDQMKLYKGIPGDKEIHVIEGAHHAFREEQHLKETEEIIKNWIDNKLLK